MNRKGYVSAALEVSSSTGCELGSYCGPGIGPGAGLPRRWRRCICRKAVDQVWGQIRGERKIAIGNLLVDGLAGHSPDAELVDGVVVLEIHRSWLVKRSTTVEEEMSHGLVVESLGGINDAAVHGMTSRPRQVNNPRLKQLPVLVVHLV